MDDNHNIPAKSPNVKGVGQANKIEAIKALRVYMTNKHKLFSSLSVFKWIVENIKTFLAYVDSKGLPPSLDNIEDTVGTWAWGDLHTPDPDYSVDKALTDSGFKLMDLTPPGAPLEGHIYLNDPTGETITYYKSTKTAYSAKPGGETQQFINPETLLYYLSSKLSKQTLSNALSQTEMNIITDVAKSYGLLSTIDYIGPKANGTSFIVISDKSGKRQFTIRKLANRFHFYKIVYKPNVHYSGDFGGDAEGILQSAEWNTLVKEMHVQFATFTQSTMTTPDKDKSKLSMSEMKVITDLAGKYMLQTENVESQNFTQHVKIKGNMGSSIWAVRKFESMYEIINILNPNDWEKLEIEPTFAEMLMKLKKLFDKYIAPSQKPVGTDVNKFSPEEIKAIDEIASSNHLLTDSKVMTLEPDKHKVAAVNMLSPSGEVHWTMFKDNGKYKLYKVFGTTWDLYTDTDDFQLFINKLSSYLHNQLPIPPEPAAATEHNGITPEENEKIKEAVDSYGEKFWTEYVKASTGQSAYVEIFYKPAGPPADFIFSIEAIGNYYQINGPDNKPNSVSPTLNGVIAGIHDILSEKSGQTTITPKDLNEIISLAQKLGFDYTPPEGDEPYTLVDNDNIIEVKYNSVWYTIGGVFGPIYLENSKTFLNWFKNVYAKGKVPTTGTQFVQNLYNILDSDGFLDKDGKIIPHQKINAIKEMRFYIMQITGGPCSLKKTKWAAENLQFFFDHIKKNGLPNMETDAPDLHVQIQEPPHMVSVDNKLTGEETISVEAIVSKHSPAITYQPSGDAIVIWIGNHLTSYKVAKEQDVYRVYTDKDSEWVIQNQFSTFNELKDYLEEMLGHIATALKNTKLEQPPVKTEPSALFPDMLSPSEVAEVKKLVKKFKLFISTTYSKKLMEAKGGPKENNAYNLVIVDEPHNVWIKINKVQGEYIISKGLKDAYFPLKTFYYFDGMLAYLDYFLNSYIKEEPLEMEKISDEEVKLLKDLVKKYNVKTKVRRKYMMAKGQGKVPYVFIETDDFETKNYALSKTAKGTYKLFETDIELEDWKNVAITDSWDGMYDIITKVLSGEPIPDDAENHKSSVLTPDQFEWLETFMKIHKPGVFIKQWGNGGIGGYDPSIKINGENNPLFVIRNSPDSGVKKILQVQTEDGGMAADEYPFNTFEALSQFIVQNLEVVTQLLKTEQVPESKLAAVMDEAGFEYKTHKEIALSTGSKIGTIYENEGNERLYLWDDGSSRLWYKNQDNGETYKKEFANVAELVQWMEEHYQSKLLTQKGDWSTGDNSLDSLIKTSGFHYQGEEDTPDHGKKFVFRDVFGTNLYFYVNDKTSSLKFPMAKLKSSKGISFTTPEDLEAYLQNYADKPKATVGNKPYASPKAEEDSFAKNAGYAGLLKTLKNFEFKDTKTVPAPDEQPYKVFKRPDGAQVMIWDTGVCAYTAASDKAAGKYSNSFAELDDKLKKLYSNTKSYSGDQYIPSGEVYTVHNNEANASLIWLNKHDSKLLEALAFSPVPEENYYYKNPSGNIVKFFDTGKAEYVDYFDHPDKPENGEVIEFDNIPHALKFMVAKHSSYPFSTHNYKTEMGDDIKEIQLTSHDEGIMESLGFKWTAMGKSYVKILGPNDTPKINLKSKTNQGGDVGSVKESKKKKGDSQMFMQFGSGIDPSGSMPHNPGPPSDEDQHEVFTAYNTGKSIWQRMQEDGANTKELEIQEGSITNILHFIWQRWKHQLQVGLMGNIVAKGLPPNTNGPKDIIAFLNIEGVEAPPNIHEKFLKRGFIYETSLKGYYKAYKEPPEKLWTLVKWDGDTYYVSRPYKENNGTYQFVVHKEFTSVDSSYVLNTIKKIENSEFGDLVQTEEEALAKGDANYFNSPNGWMAYHPYSPKLNPNNVKPASWIDKELGAYGFEWSNNSHMYWFKDENGKTNLGGNWQAVRFDNNGTFVYFYTGKDIVTGENAQRYFCSKDFSQIQLKLEMVNGDTGKQQVADQPKLFNPMNYPTGPSWGKNFSNTGKAMKLKHQDHMAVLGVGFKFFTPSNTYENNNTKDKFKIFDNGFVWYNLTGTGEGQDNSIGHFFEMLKSKYGDLESGGQSLTGHEVVQIKEKMVQLGFEEKPQKTTPEDLYFTRVPKDLADKTTMKIHEMVVVFPNHLMTFYLVEDVSGLFLGSFEFQSLTYGVQVLSDMGAGGIALHLSDDLSTQLHNHGFNYVPKHGRYEFSFGTGGVIVSLAFYGNGQAWAHLLKPDSSTSGGMEAHSEKLFSSFFDAIIWAATKDFDAQTVSPTIPNAKPVDEKEVKKVMKDLGLVDKGVEKDGSLLFSNSMGKAIYVDPKIGKVTYSFQYIADDKTGELLWGQSVFYNWEVFMDFLKGTTQVKPKSGKLPFTPHPATKELPKIPPPGQGPPIQGKVQAPAMPFSNFDYEGWAKGMEHNPKSTIKLVNNDDLLMHQIGFFSKKTAEDAYYYHNNKGDLVYFFVDGHAQIIPKGQTPITLPKVKMAIGMLWAEYYEAGGKMPKPPKTEPKSNVIVALNEMGFFSIISSGNSITFEKKTPELKHIVKWDKNDNTLDYTASKIGDPSVVTVAFTEDVNEGLAMLKNIFTPKTTEQDIVVEKMEGMGFKVLGGKPPKGAQSNTITFQRFTPAFIYDVIYHVEQKMMEFIKSTAKLQKGYHKIVEQWTLSVPEAIDKMENLFSFGTLGTVTPKKKKTTNKMPWSNMNYVHTKAAQQMGKNPVYTTITLYSIEEETLKKMGYHRLENNGVKWYEKSGTGQYVQFFADGHASITDKITGTDVEYFDTVKEAMKFLWDKYMPFIEESFFKDLVDVLMTRPDAAKMLM